MDLTNNNGLIKVFDEDDRTFLSDGDKVIQPISALITETKNGEFYLELEVMPEDVPYIKNSKVVAAKYRGKWQGFRVRNSENTDRTYCYFKCMHVSNDIHDNTIADLLLDGTPLPEALVQLQNAVRDTCNIELTTEDTNNVNIYVEVHNNSLGEIIELIAEEYNLVVVRDNFTIKLIPADRSIFDKGRTIECGKNLSTITKYEDTDNLVTKIYPFMTVGNVEYSIPPIEDNTLYKNVYPKSLVFTTRYQDYFDMKLNKIQEMDKQIDEYAKEIDKLENKRKENIHKKGEYEDKLHDELVEYNDLSNYYRTQIANNEALRDRIFKDFQSMCFKALNTYNDKKTVKVKTRDELKNKLKDENKKLETLEKDYDYNYKKGYSKKTNEKKKKGYQDKAKKIREQINKQRETVRTLEQKIRDCDREISQFDSKIKKIKDYRDKYQDANSLSTSTIEGIIAILQELGLKTMQGLAKEYADANKVAKDKPKYIRDMNECSQKILEYRSKIEECKTNIDNCESNVIQLVSDITALQDAIAEEREIIKSEVEADLREQAEIYLNQYKYPQVSYNTTIFSDEDVTIGEVIEVKNSTMGIDILTDVVQVQYNCLTETIENCTFGNSEDVIQGIQGIFNKLQNNMSDKIEAALSSIKTDYSSLNNQIITLQSTLLAMLEKDNEEDILDLQTKINKLLANLPTVYDGHICLENAHVLKSINPDGSYRNLMHIGSNGAVYIATDEPPKGDNGNYMHMVVGNELLSGMYLNASRVRLGANGHYVDITNSAFRPLQSGLNLGQTGTANRFNNGYFSDKLYAGNATIQTSDAKEKKYISDIDDNLATDLIMGLKPKTYKFKKEEDAHEGKRWKAGFIAQPTSELCRSLDKELAICEAHVVNEDGTWSDYDPETMQDIPDEQLTWGMDYTAIISPHVKVTQMHEERIKMLEEENTKLKSKISDLENKVEQLAKLLVPQEETQE